MILAALRAALVASPGKLDADGRHPVEAVPGDVEHDTRGAACDVSEVVGCKRVSGEPESVTVGDGVKPEVQPHRVAVYRSRDSLAGRDPDLAVVVEGAEVPDRGDQVSLVVDTDDLALS